MKFSIALLALFVLLGLVCIEGLKLPILSGGGGAGGHGGSGYGEGGSGGCGGGGNVETPSLVDLNVLDKIKATIL
ncbi:hypothetical protein M0802_004975 [Mischocyttarus mexicanus]|nr:hypothetical protein M0802_004975 [Mischocyttarus mexicanus]